MALDTARAAFRISKFRLCLLNRLKAAINATDQAAELDVVGDELGR